MKTNKILKEMKKATNEYEKSYICKNLKGKNWAYRTIGFENGFYEGYKKGISEIKKSKQEVLEKYNKLKLKYNELLDEYETADKICGLRKVKINELKEELKKLK